MIVYREIFSSVGLCGRLALLVTFGYMHQVYIFPIYKFRGIWLKNSDQGSNSRILQKYTTFIHCPLPV